MIQSFQRHLTVSKLAQMSWCDLNVKRLSVRLNEHRKQTTSALWKHQTSHSIDWEELTVIDYESVDGWRRIREAT